MISLETIEEHLKFIVVEVQSQLNLTFSLLYNPSLDLLEKIVNKDDYVDNLKNTVENKCFSRIHSVHGLDAKEIARIRSIHIICVNLERIADFCVNTARQMSYLTEYGLIHESNYRDMFSEIQRGLSLILPVFTNRDLTGALDICKTEISLDRMYKTNFDWIMAELSRGRNTGNLITALFIFRYLERIGDALLNIGEALIFSIIGDRIKIRQFEALQETLSQSGFEGALSDIGFESFWGSRSGCRVGKVGQKEGDGRKIEGVFKEGTISKIKLERENIQRWNRLAPGLPPRILGYYEKGDLASLLVEFLPGCTLDEVVLTAGDDILDNAFFIFEQTLTDVWQKTRVDEPYATDYIQQLQARLESIKLIHPDFFRTRLRIGSLEVRSSEELLEQCGAIEKDLRAPFTVFIHGDLNVNNIVYNHEKQVINYVDLYRSKQSDYIQDASVFLVSNFRLPLFEPRMRQRLNSVIRRFFNFTSQFAAANADTSFDVRLAIALARSFFTSTRFELNQGFAKDMFLRTHYLMEKIIDHKGKPWAEFRLPVNVLYY